MGDVVKALVSAPANAVLLVAGLAFLAVAIFRRITDKLDAGPKGRVFAGVLGAILIGLSLYLSTDGKNPDATTASTASTVESASGAVTSGATNAQPSGSFPVELPAGQVVKEEDRSYTILKIVLDRYQIDQLSLTFTVRLLYQGAYPTNFWNSNFRLLVDGVPQEPTNMLDEVVAPNSAKEGAVSFAFPGSANNVALQIDKFGPDAPGLPMKLPAQP